MFDRRRNQPSYRGRDVYLVDELYLVTAFVPSETACLASSPGKMSRTLEQLESAKKTTHEADTYEVWISRDEMVDFLL